MSNSDACLMFDCAMLVGAGGIERTENELRELLARASCKLTRTAWTNGPYSVIEALPVT